MEDKLLEISDEILEKLLEGLPISDSAKGSMRAFHLMRRELTKESDRGVALLATAHLDYELEELLRDKLIGNKKHLKELFSFNGPVGTFSAKIKLGYSIGLINKDTMDDINILRKIRNEFAHSNQAIDFETENIKSLCNNLKLNVKDEEEPSRTKFINVVSGISGRIEGALSSVAKFEELKNPSLEDRKKEYDKMMDTLFGNLK